MPVQSPVCGSLFGWNQPLLQGNPHQPERGDQWVIRAGWNSENRANVCGKRQQPGQSFTVPETSGCGMQSLLIVQARPSCHRAITRPRQKHAVFTENDFMINCLPIQCRHMDITQVAMKDYEVWHKTLPNQCLFPALTGFVSGWGYNGYRVARSVDTVRAAGQEALFAGRGNLCFWQDAPFGEPALFTHFLKILH